MTHRGALASPTHQYQYMSHPLDLILTAQAKLKGDVSWNRCHGLNLRLARLDCITSAVLAQATNTNQQRSGTLDLGSPTSDTPVRIYSSFLHSPATRYEITSASDGKYI